MNRECKCKLFFESVGGDLVVLRNADYLRRTRQSVQAGTSHLAGRTVRREKHHERGTIPWINSGDRRRSISSIKHDGMLSRKSLWNSPRAALAMFGRAPRAEGAYIGLSAMRFSPG